MTNAKTIVLDIETAPNVVYTWQIGQKISIGHDNILEERRIICICWKEMDGKKTHSLTWDDNQNDRAMLEEFFSVASTAEVLIGHNGDNFDLKYIKTRGIYHRLPPLTNLISIDTLKLVRSNFNFNSNKLDYVSQYLGLGQKLETGGLRLWKDVLNGDEAALKKMVKYCKKDVALLENVLYTILPYVNSTPVHFGLVERDTRDACPACGSEAYKKHGTRATKVGRRQRYMCVICFHTWQDNRLIKEERKE